MAKKPKPKAKAEPVSGTPKCRRGVPSPETVVAEGTVTSPTGGVYRVLRTTQVDGYEAPPAKRKRRGAK
jgi:hypothetical protein